MRRNQPGHWVLDLGRNAVDHHTKGHTSSTPSCENHRSHHCSFAHPDDRHNSWCTSSRSPGSTLRGNDMRSPQRQERITRTCWHTCGLALRNVRVFAPLKPSSRSRHGTTAGGGAGPILSLKHSSNHSVPGKRDTPHATLVSSMVEGYSGPPTAIFSVSPRVITRGGIAFPRRFLAPDTLAQRGSISQAGAGKRVGRDSTPHRLVREVPSSRRRRLRSRR